ncbi:unnamed protein product [Mytilus coruscus]|uniref:Reverse transcriptase domain-containing protein n=1 Tax=Mytilus coruscus TaxID=42192 RepID=A0A6J8DJA4_MYTCO|nr:unnamed protein product [Mytilus coruscus]
MNSARKDKRAFVDKLTAEAGEAARANNIKALYDNIKLLTGNYQKGSRPQEFNSSLYSVVVDFAKAFDSLDRDVLWQLMRHYGIPEKFITIIRNTYTGMQSKIIHKGQLTEAFDIAAGERKGCLLSPMLFLLAVDWTMNQATDGRRNGIQWTMFTQLDDLDFADDITLLSHNHQQMQDKIAQVEKRAAKTGLSINHKKTKVLKSKTRSLASLMVNAQVLEEIDSFTYLGRVVDNLGG